MLPTLHVPGVERSTPATARSARRCPSYPPPRASSGDLPLPPVGSRCNIAPPASPPSESDTGRLRLLELWDAELVPEPAIKVRDYSEILCGIFFFSGGPECSRQAALERHRRNQKTYRMTIAGRKTTKPSSWLTGLEKKPRVTDLQRSLGPRQNLLRYDFARGSGQVLTLHYTDKRSMGSISRELGINRKAVMQIVERREVSEAQEERWWLRAESNCRPAGYERVSAFSAGL